MKKTVLVLLADGFEEIEAITPIDVLRRAGLSVKTAGVGQREVTGSHGVKVVADLLLKEYKDVPDAVVLPGGQPGADNLRASKEVQALLSRMKNENKMIAAICASPARVLVPSGILEGKRATCYPGFENEFGKTATFVADRVVTDGHVVTSQGPGTALEFSLELARQLVGDEIAEKVSDAMVVK